MTNFVDNTPLTAEELNSAFAQSAAVNQQTVTNIVQSVLTAPGPIGSTTPNTGTFTTLAASVLAAGSTASRSLAARFADTYTPEDFGAVGDGVTDDTAALQAAVNGSKHLHLLNFYRTTAPINITSAIRITGDHPGQYAGWALLNANGVPVPQTGAYGPKSFLFFDHAGAGLYLTGPAISHTTLEGFGTCRRQTLPAVGAPSWTPNVTDYDIKVLDTGAGGDSGVGGYIRDVLLFNTSNGISIVSACRWHLKGIRAEAYNNAIYFDNVQDTCYISGVHIFPFYSLASSGLYTQILDYTVANLDAIWCGRLDNPLFSEIFSISHRSAFRFSTTANGSPSRIHICNSDLDESQSFIWIDTTCTAVDILAVNVTSQQIAGVTNAPLLIQGASAGAAVALLVTQWKPTYCQVTPVAIASTVAGSVMLTGCDLSGTPNGSNVVANASANCVVKITGGNVPVETAPSDIFYSASRTFSLGGATVLNRGYYNSTIQLFGGASFQITLPEDEIADDSIISFYNTTLFEISIVPGAGQTFYNGNNFSAYLLLAGSSVSFIRHANANEWDVLAQSIEPSSVVTAVTATTGTTLWQTYLVGAAINRSGPTAAFTDTTDNATDLLAVLPAPLLNTSWKLKILNMTSVVETIAGGTGVTIAGNATIAAQSWREFLVTLTAVATPAFTMTNLGTGAL